MLLRAMELLDADEAHTVYVGDSDVDLQTARAAGVPSLRCDTHADNATMQHTLEKNGYIRCGTIYLADGAPRIGYERVL